MNLDYATLDALRRNHPGWRLLLADSAPLRTSTTPPSTPCAVTTPAGACCWPIRRR